MLTRHQSRELVLQALFNLDFKQVQKPSSQAVLENIFYIFYSKDKEQKVNSFTQNIFDGVLEKKDIIDQELEKNTQNWTLEKTASIDRNILRIGYYEMFFSEDVPARVAINEAIELAKTFGQKNSFKFVAGVLGNLYENSGLKNKEK